MNHELSAEKVLIQRVLRGDSRAIHRLFRELQPKLLRYVQSRVKSRIDAEELVQDTFLSLLDALPLFGFKSSVWTFAVGIARHEIADYWRKYYAKKVIHAVPLVGALYDRALYSAEETATDLHTAVERVYSLLNPHHAQLLIWKYEDHLSVGDIAQRLKISVKAAESKLYRARVVFQVKYRELYAE